MDYDEIRDFVEPFLPGPVQGDVIVRRGIPAFKHQAAPRIVESLHALQRAASSVPGRITVHPKYSEPNTASGRALLGHEYYHQWQFENIPNLEDRYAKEAARVEAAGLPPYANKFERPAYQVEVEIYYASLEDGFPPGRHTPLLIEDGLAALTDTLGGTVLSGAALAVGATIVVLTMGIFGIKAVRR